MRRRFAVFGPLVLAALCAVPASAGPRPAARSVAPGWDLFHTPSGGGRIALQTPVGGTTVMTFEGVPLGTYDFPGIGTRRVGATDTIVRRLDTATPAKPRVRIELVGLLLRSTNVSGYYATLQSTRPLGAPSTGTLDISFDRAGKGGAMRSELVVNYDIRYGAPDGPIVYTGSTGLGFVADDVRWLHEQANPIIRVPEFDLCHSAGGAIPHAHCVATSFRLAPIDGVNHRLNGRDTSADFHPTGQA